MFIDRAKITVKSGDGGRGCVSFRREKFVPRGGPSGGDGGRGGHIYAEATSKLHTLSDLRYKRVYNAPKGAPGEGSNKTGKTGEDLILRVPCGTIITDNKGNVICDLVDDGQKELLAKGGLGGKGNSKFATPTNRTPIKYQEGIEGESLDIILELKLIADVGLVGKPNAGKSTLLSRMSSARPKIAGYPFTTLKPMLGIVSVGDYNSFVMADIPGLIKDAHLGKGLGDRFLRHIERTKLLVYLIDLTDPNPEDTLKELKNELISYNAELKNKKSIVVYSKADLFPKPPDMNTNVISSVSGVGVGELKKDIYNLLHKK